MPTYVSLVRGINVGGKTLKMELLRDLYAGLGAKNVRTYIQSGNVVFDAAKLSSAAFSARVVDAIAKKAKLEVSVLTLSASELRAAISKNPFVARGCDPKKLHATFLERAPASFEKLAAIDAGEDEHYAAGAVIFLHCPNGYGKTKLSNAAVEKALSVAATTRNWNTVLTLDRMANSPLPRNAGGG